MFRRKSREFTVAWEPKPWWRRLSLPGWGLLFLALFATFGFVLGLLQGEVLFLPTYKSKSGAISVSIDQAPVFFIVLMTINALIAGGIWYLFVSWLRGRRT